MLTRQQLNDKIITSIVGEHYSSTHYADMLESDKYYLSENTNIYSRRRMMALIDEVETIGIDGIPIVEEIPYTREDFSKANHKLAHGFHYELTNQVKNLLAGTPVKLSWKDEESNRPDITDDVKQIVDDILFRYNDWGTFNQENIKNTQKYVNAWMRVTIDPENGAPRLLNINSKEIIAFEDELGKLTLVIRVYELENYDEDGKKVKTWYAEAYDDKYKDVYTKTSKSSEYKITEKDVPLLTVNTVFEDEHGQRTVKESEHLSWGRIPFVKWQYNTDGINALKPIKPFIDLLDIELSDLGNDIEDWREAIWILENYNGQSIADFLDDIHKKGAIKVGDGGNARPERNEIPYDARLKLYEVLENNIYRFGRGVDFSKRDNLGNITGVGLKWSYELLEEKANEIEVNGHKALNELFDLIFRYLNITGVTPTQLDSNDVEFLFERSLLINEKENVENVLKASSIISTETALDKLTIVDDVEEEMKRLENEGRGAEIYEDEQIDAATTDAIRRLERKEDEARDRKDEQASSGKFYGSN